MPGAPAPPLLLDLRLVELRRLAVLGVGIGQRLVPLRGGARGAEGGHLDDLAAEEDVRQAEAPAHEPAVAEQPLHLLRQRVGRDVEVLRFQAEQQIAHAAADQKRP